MNKLAKQCIDLILAIESGGDPEGGYNNLLTDRGGETKWGISKRSYPNEDIKNLTRDRAFEIYYNDYWVPMKCEEYPNAIAIHLFDQAVNGGAASANKVLEQTRSVLGGSVLMDAGNTAPLIYADFRKRRYATIARDRMQLFNLRGWLARVDRITDEIRKGTFA